MVLTNEETLFFFSDPYCYIIFNLNLGFIGGVKMMLPDDVKRTDNKQYEEVDIPPQSPGQLTVGNEKVPVSSLDEVNLKF